MIPVTDIIPLNTQDTDLPLMGVPVSENESKIDSSFGPPLSESEGYVDAGNISPDFSDTHSTPNTQALALQGYQSGPDFQREHWLNQSLHPTP